MLKLQHFVEASVKLTIAIRNPNFQNRNRVNPTPLPTNLPEENGRIAQKC